MVSNCCIVSKYEQDRLYIGELLGI